ncbi:methyl-accepting chemotaxis protein [Sphaerotilus sp.]|uniref:methyl-accepting chemotaxis protein n=1 Tax=Sphaerotilus sp. TaxID=2093942 RepID=UPI00286D7078|nr:methyl-accepting chemotaxis protein [Sphaerotilus sp.]
MSAILPKGSAVPTFTPVQPIDTTGFFAHHGLWAPGVRLFRRMGFTAKALIVLLSFALPVGALLALQLVTLSDTLLDSRKEAAHQQVDTVHHLLDWAHTQETSGVLTRPAAQALARQAITGLHHGAEAQVWIHDQHLGDLQNTNGGGFVPHQDPPAGSAAPANQLAYVQGFDPWGWVIGSAVHTAAITPFLQRQMRLVMATLLGALLVTVYLGLSFYKVMQGGLQETRRHLTAMTSGDLTTSPAPWGRDEAAVLMGDLKRMQDALRQMVASVRRCSDAMADSSLAMAAGMQDLATRSDQSAASLQESSTAMEEILVAIQQGSAHTEEVARMARQTAAVAADGGQEMRVVIETMDGIRTSSARIAEILGTIDGIAFQTNILALNAAVEAARAGEHGRGFAVVAGEVRMLANRSTEAAREIKQLIGSSVGEVKAGTAVVRRAGATIDAIVGSSRRVNELLDDVAAGTRAQRTGIEQIGQAMQTLDQTTQRNAALVEKTAAAAAAMTTQAGTLCDAVARFRLPGGRPDRG